MTSLLSLCLMLGIHQGSGEESGRALSLKASAKLGPLLSQAREKITKQEWSDAIQSLQTILDDETPFFKTQEGKVRNAYQQANQLLSKMPSQAKDLYESKYGTIASTLLKKAKDRKSLTAVVRRFRHTRAGATAENRLRAFLKDATRPRRATKSGMPIPTSSWDHSLIQHEEVRQVYYSALARCRKLKFPVIAPVSPLLVTLRQGEKEQTLVAYRNDEGLEVRDAVTGKMHWKAPFTDWSVARLARQADLGLVFSRWWERSRRRELRPDLLFANTTVHRLSTDGKRIYTVEDFVHPPLVNWTFLDAGEELERMPKKIETALKFNRLQAYDLETGKIQWELGKPKETHFLCAPLPVGERLHVMAQTKRELRLLTLDPKSGRLSQSMVLGKALTPVERDPIRRWNAHSLIRHEDLMICLTNLGHVIAVDLMTQKPRWIYRYKVHQKGLPWWNARPVVHGERLFLTLADDVKNLHCLNVKTGKLLWTRSKDRSLYLAGAQGERALLIQTNGCYAVHVKDGSIAWTRPTGDVCGLGTFANGRYFLPLSRGLETKKPELCEVELTNGTIRSRMPLSKSLGNVVFHRDRLLSLGVQEIRSYELIDKWLATLDRRLKKKPNDVPLRRERGTVRFHLGRLDLAIEDLKVAKKNLKGAEQEKVEGTLIEAMLRLMDRDFQKGRKHLKECERLCRQPKVTLLKQNPTAWTEMRRKRLGNFYLVLGRARERQKQYREALQAYSEATRFFEEQKMTETVIERTGQPSLKQTVQTWLRSRALRLSRLMKQR